MRRPARPSRPRHAPRAEQGAAAPLVVVGRVVVGRTCPGRPGGFPRGLDRPVAWSRSRRRLMGPPVADSASAGPPRAWRSRPRWFPRGAARPGPAARDLVQGPSPRPGPAARTGGPPPGAEAAPGAQGRVGGRPHVLAPLPSLAELFPRGVRTARSGLGCGGPGDGPPGRRAPGDDRRPGHAEGRPPRPRGDRPSCCSLTGCTDRSRSPPAERPGRSRCRTASSRCRRSRRPSTSRPWPPRSARPGCCGSGTGPYRPG